MMFVRVCLDCGLRAVEAHSFCDPLCVLLSPPSSLEAEMHTQTVGERQPGHLR